MNRSEKVKPTISGHMTFELDTNEEKSKESERILDSIKMKVKFRWRKTGSYVFSGGIIAYLNLIENKSGHFIASLRFLRAKPFFLDNLVNAILSKTTRNTLSCSIKGELDFDKIRDHFREDSEWYAESDESFSARKRLNEHDIQVAAYPKMTILNFMCDYQDQDTNYVLPSKIVKNLCKIGGGTI